MNNTNVELTHLLKSLVRSKTVVGKTDQFEIAINLIKTFFADLDINIAEFTKNNFRSIVITPDCNRHQKIFLSGHIDVVEATDLSFIPKIEGTKLFGRGTSDMKGQVVAMMFAYRNIITQNPTASVGLMITTDEEQGGTNGVGYLLQDEGYTCDVVFLPDGSRGDWGICTDEKGLYWAEIITRGASSHGSRPWEGENAIEYFFDFYKNFRSQFESKFCTNILQEDIAHNWFSTTNLSVINAGAARNSVPDFLKATIDIRFTHNWTKRDIELFFSNLLLLYPKISIENTLYANPTHINQESLELRSLYKVLENLNIPIQLYKTHGASDGRFFADKNIPIVSIKPTASDIHIENEWIDLVDLAKFVDVIEGWILEYLDVSSKTT